MKRTYISMCLLVTMMAFAATACGKLSAVNQVGSDAKRVEANGPKSRLANADDHGVSDLLAAVGAGDISLVRELLEAGANPNAVNVARSPLITAISQLDQENARLVCNIEIVKLLLDHGADPNIRDPSRDTTPLHFSLALGQIECAKLLKKKGADISALDPKGRTVLDAAVSGAVHIKSLEVISLVLGWGIDPNVRGSVGATSLALAVWLNSEEVVEYLLEKGVDPCIAGTKGLNGTPLHVAMNLKVSDAIISRLERATKCI
jgi:ankyrin repeat protein